MSGITRQQLIQDYQRVAQQLDKRPTLQEYNQHGNHSSTPIYNLYESFEAFKDAAGYQTGQHKIPTQDLINDLQRLANEIGRSPPIEVYDEHGKYNSKTLKNRFGNWSEVLDEGGLEPTNHSKHWSDVNPEIWSYTGSVEVECGWCGASVHRKPYAVQRYSMFFCDRECKHNHMHSLQGEESRRWKGGKAEMECEVCGEMYKVKPAKADTSRCCSLECDAKWRETAYTGENHPRWTGGYSRRYYGPTWLKARKVTLERDDYTCQVCGIDKQSHWKKYGATHDVHHIIPFSEFDDSEAANDLDNLITVCKRCHQYVEHGKIEVPSAIWYRKKVKSVLP